MPTRTALFARVIDDVETRRRRLYRDAVCQLVSNKSTIIPLVPRRHRRVLPYEPSDFQLDNYTDDWCLEFLRFSRQEIREILPFFGLDMCTWRNRCHPSPEAAFCLLLYKLSWPHRLKDTLYLFGRSLAWQSSVYIDTLRHLVVRYRDMLFWDHTRLVYWNKKFHGFKFQAISTPDGLITFLAGLTTAADGDWAMRHESEIELVLHEVFDGMDPDTEPSKQLSLPSP